MAFTENSVKCSNDNSKRFTCYHLISDNIFKLLTNTQNHNDKNVNTNQSSVIISGLDPNPDRYLSNNPSDIQKQSEYDKDDDTNNPSTTISNIHT